MRRERAGSGGWTRFRSAEALALGISVFLFFLFFRADGSGAREPVSGGEVFEEKRCSGCHTLGRGRFVGPDLLGVGRRYSRDEIVKWAKDPGLVYEERGKKPVNAGYPPMPPMNLSSEEAAAVADYLLDYSVPPGLSEKGTISGLIKNATTGGHEAGQEVVLVSYMGDRPVGGSSTDSDSGGRFLFSDLEWDRSYELSLLYEGVMYVSGKMVFSPEEDEIALDLPVYDTTDSDAGVSLPVLNVIVYPNDEATAVNLTFLYDFRNSSDTVFVGKRAGSTRRTLEFSVPEYVEEVIFSGGVDPAETEREGKKVYYSGPFLPGPKRVALSYSVGVSKLGRKFPVGLDYEAGDFTLFVRRTDLGIEFEGGDFVREDVVIHGERFARYEKSAVRPSEAGFLTVSRPFAETAAGTYLPVGLFVAAVAAGIVFVLFGRKRNSRKTA